MLFLLSGAAASGKKTAARQLITRVANLAAHHENEIPPTTGQTRMANMGRWVDTALRLEAQGVDLLLPPRHHRLARVSARARAGGIAACPDCHDHERSRRSRGASRTRTGRSGWTCLLGSGHRMHAIDPQWEQRVIRDAFREHYAWDRWCRWTHEDPRWRVELVDTTTQFVTETVDTVAGWITRVRLHGTRLARAAAWWE
jgi:hypothetical protein